MTFIDWSEATNDSIQTGSGTSTMMVGEKYIIIGLSRSLFFLMVPVMCLF